MRRYGRRDPMDRFFNIFPYMYIFIVMFAIVLTWFFIQFAAIGYINYSVITDPKGSARFIGEITSEAVKPVINTIEENQ